MKPDYKMYENLVFVTQVGIIMVVPIFGSILFGKFLDQWLNTGHIFLLVFTILGVGSSFTSFYKFAMRKINSATEKGKKKNTNNLNK